ncbi:transcriptional regulator, TetR family [Luteibacter sp. UNCMF331Sha3.1]|uniref:TetR/AcrR family transcriptional regulator n=1 Tax=Luteibacter sp. UNCMF331Sha3.1 TaxID=1502760 RepID=UPI0008C87899|nr:TetR/AcrR family transcriptional regulator [Luteibacter sp. UNCMF331Sha3.1]SEM40011.1 transcriptional regulator, TetR family [Luteibacter sp. UNCMF331Sha3.1]
MRADAKKNYDHLLSIAQKALLEQGADVSMRDIARQADVGVGTLYRHFPTREALLDALLRSSFDDLAGKANELNGAAETDKALLVWLEEVIAFTHAHRGILEPMMSAIEDPASALHESCVRLKTAGASLLRRAQADGTARPDLDGAELFDLIAALAWLREQPAHAQRAARLFNVVAGAVLKAP